MNFFVILCLFSFCAAKNLPDYVKVCRPKHTDVSKCIIDNIENVFRPRLINGIREMGIPSIDPLKIPYAEVNLGNGFNTSVKNLKLWELKSFILEDLSVDLERLTIKIKIKIPFLRADLDYNVKGKLLILTLDGTGPGQMNITNLEATITGTGSKILKNGREYLSIKNMDITPKVGGMTIRLDNLFPKNPEITDNANKLLNDNSEIVIQEFSPLVVDIVKTLIWNAFNRITANYPFDVLFPND